MSEHRGAGGESNCENFLGSPQSVPIWMESSEPGDMGKCIVVMATKTTDTSPTVNGNGTISFYVAPPRILQAQGAMIV
ncbi:MAG: hypothetical protein GY820_04250 [Gammaproteobacteria bacterium]|nr:hypothetical protein [Gammaproteobacteria bacterium]